MSNSTSAVWPSAETWSACAGSSGERRFLIVRNGCTVATTSLTAARNAGSSTVSVLLWTSTISVCGSVWKPASLRMWSARCGLADVGVVLVDLLRADRRCRWRRRRRRTRASRRPRSSSDSRSSGPSGPRCCSTASAVTWQLSFSTRLVVTTLASHRAHRRAVRRAGVLGCGYPHLFRLAQAGSRGISDDLQLTGAAALEKRASGRQRPERHARA